MYLPISILELHAVAPDVGKRGYLDPTGDPDLGDGGDVAVRRRTGACAAREGRGEHRDEGR